MMDHKSGFAISYAPNNLMMPDAAITDGRLGRWIETMFTVMSGL